MHKRKMRVLGVYVVKPQPKYWRSFEASHIRGGESREQSGLELECAALSRDFFENHAKI